MDNQYPILVEYFDENGNPAYYFSEAFDQSELKAELMDLSKRFRCDVTASRIQVIDTEHVTYVPNANAKY